MVEIPFARDPKNGISTETLVPYFRSLGFKVKANIRWKDTPDYEKGRLISPVTGIAYFPDTKLTLQKGQIIDTTISRRYVDGKILDSWLVVSNFDFDLSQIFPPQFFTVYKNKKYIFTRKELGSSFNMIERWDVVYGVQSKGYVKKTKLGEIRPVRSLEFSYSMSEAEKLTASITREDIKQLPSYSKLLDLGLTDFSSPIQVKNETFLFGWSRINIKIPNNISVRDLRSFASGFVSNYSWIDDKGRFRETFQVSKNGSIRLYPLGSQDKTIKKLKSPFNIEDWDLMFNTLYEYLINKQIPKMEEVGIYVYKTEQDRYDNRDIIALDTLLESINKNMKVLLFEDFNSDEVKIPYSEKGPLHWSSKTKTFSGYVSELEHICPVLKSKIPHNLSVEYNGMKVSYRFTKEDKDGTDEDTYGWNFESTNGKFKSYLLLIND